MRAVLGVNGRNQRIGDGLKSSVREGEDEGPAKKQIEGGCLTDIRGRRERDDRRQHMEQEGCPHQFSVADFVHHDAAENDAETETRKACSADEANLTICEAEECFPLSGEAIAQSESNACGEDGHETGH